MAMTRGSPPIGSAIARLRTRRPDEQRRTGERSIDLLLDGVTRPAARAPQVPQVIGESVAIGMPLRIDSRDSRAELHARSALRFANR
jgi:hypothetical protein